MALEKAACIGAGVIGAGWAARLAFNGVDVKLYDPDPRAPGRLADVMANADRAMAKLTIAPFPTKGSITFSDSLGDAVNNAQLIIECAPEREDLKKKILAQVEQSAPSTALIGSSTSGLLPTNLQSEMIHPERFLVTHPFQPVYLLPLVELVGGDKTAIESIEQAKEIFASLGMKPLHVRKEIDAFIADRLLEAVWRESLWMVNDDIATAQEIDDALIYGAGLRWAMMGSFLTYRIAGGELGMHHFMSQFGPALKWPWTKLMDTPELDDELLNKIVSQSDEQADGVDIRELERKRDDCLIAILQALKTQNYAAGKVLGDYEESLYAKVHSPCDETDIDYTKPLQLHQCTVLAEWVDYNGHMTESRYLQVFGDCSDALYRHLGVDSDYLENKGSYYTVETHIMHNQEVAGLQPIYATTQLLDYDEKRLHLFHSLYHQGTNDLLASCEQMMLHVDASSGRAGDVGQAMLEKVKTIAQAQSHLGKPDAAGRQIGISRR